MDQILNNLSDPAWWFTGTFFVLFGVLLTRLIFNWVPSAWKTFIGLKPKFARKVYRWKERRVLLQIKRCRQHEATMTWLITRYWCIATVSLIHLGALLALYAFLPEPADDIGKIKVLWPVAAAAYFFVLLTIWEKRVLGRAIKAHISWKKRITNHSRSPQAGLDSPNRAAP